jgi:conjugal transfer pilus assembly protein TraU
MTLISIKRIFRSIFAVVLSYVGICGVAVADNTTVPNSPVCHGRFLNPITDICWSCAFPLKVGSASMLTLGQEDNNSESGSNPFCDCLNGANSTFGIKVSFWEPVRVFEAVRIPYCFPELGGLNLDVGIVAPPHGREARIDQTRKSFYQAHWYANPIMYWLEVLADDNCLEGGVFDLAYITEVDPLWASSEASFIVNPDVGLFTNLLAQAACAADCVAATAGFPLNSLFWCAGCQGNMYPLVGWVTSHIGGAQASSLLMQRMTNKLHREGAMWGASGDDGLCGYYPQPLMDKTDYKAQMIYPVSATDKHDGKCCTPYGRSTVVWQAGKEFPYAGEDFAYQIFRKRDCCQGAYSP